MVGASDDCGAGAGVLPRQSRATNDDDTDTMATTRRAFSCKRCTRRKQRCDKILPTCTPCLKAKVDCGSIARETMTSQSPASKGIVSTLLEHISHLEADLRKRQGGHAHSEHQSTDQQSNAAAAGSVPQAPGDDPCGVQHARALPLTADAADSWTSTRESASDPTPAHTQAPPHHSGMSINILSLSAVAEPRNRAGEFLKRLSTPRLIAGVTETFGGNPEGTARVDLLWEAISDYIRRPSSASQRLHIPRHEALKALQSYLDVVDFRFPRIPVAKVRSGIDAIAAENSETAYQQVLDKNPANIFMAYAVVAIVPLVSSSYPISQGSWVSVHLLSKCLELLNRVFLQEDGVDIIQCLHLLVILSIHCSTAGSAWYLIGFAMTKCIALGYHREEPRTVAALPRSVVQQRRWAFWGCYYLDRLICAALGRPFSIENQDISAPLPGGESPGSTSPDRGSPATNGAAGPSLTLKERCSIHLFRYAILLSSAARGGTILDPGYKDLKKSFDDLLGQAMHWRSLAPTRLDPTIAEIHSHQTSLYNTLLLRIAIREINIGFVLSTPEDVALSQAHDGFDSSNHTQPSIRHRDGPHSHGCSSDGEASPVNTVEITQLLTLEQNRIRHIKLLGICRAVARSLDRTRMTTRPYLSFLTGYSAFSMGLACLYYMAVTTSAPDQDPIPAASSSFSNTESWRTPSSGGPWPSARGANGYRSSQNKEHCSMQSDLSYDPHAILDLSCHQLEIVGRQFPRLQEYRILLQRLRNLILTWPSSSRIGGERTQKLDQMAEVHKASQDVGPSHLRILAKAAIYMATLG